MKKENPAYVPESGQGAFPLTRRRLLSAGARMAAAAAAAALLPPNLRRALAQRPQRPPRPQREPPGSLRDIKHVVLLTQANRSFDHYFGTMAGVRGFEDKKALRFDNGKSVFHQPDAANPSGYLLPFHLDTGSSSAQKIPTTNHGWIVQHQCWNSGKMDQWMAAHRKADGKNAPYTMGYYVRADIPFHFALAEAFTICDAYHSSVMGPTWPNRLYAMTGTIDADGQNGDPVISNKMPPGGFTWTTYAERLEKAGISWKVYQQKDNFGNILENFKAFRDARPESPLYKKGLIQSAPDQFEQDALNDRLPTVSWIIPTSEESEHPDFMPAAGAAFVARKLEALAANPDVWAKTAFILNYDENDGIFDHVVPPTPPAGTLSEFVQGLPIGGGFRVPCIIVSPWTAGGWVCTETFDHTSVLQFLEKITGVEEPNISAWRRETFGDLTAAFRFEDRKAQNFPNLPDASGALARVKLELRSLPKPTLPGADQSMPIQEQGPRRRIPRPEA